MSRVWYPGATILRGAAANYALGGPTVMSAVVCHYTVGINSIPVGRQGYFHFLISRDGTVTQFAEVDAKCWHAGDPWNERGPGIEVEYLESTDGPDILTPDAANSAANLTAWISETYPNIPLSYYDNPANRTLNYNGYISHRSVIEDADYHDDYWPYFPLLTPSAERCPDVTIMWINFNGMNVYLVQGGIIVHQFPNKDQNQFGIPKDAEDFNNFTHCGIVGMSGSEWSALLHRSGITP